jgi:hypothetical protein
MRGKASLSSLAHEKLDTGVGASDESIAPYARLEAISYHILLLC